MVCGWWWCAGCGCCCVEPLLEPPELPAPPPDDKSGDLERFSRDLRGVGCKPDGVCDACCPPAKLPLLPLAEELSNCPERDTLPLDTPCCVSRAAFICCCCCCCCWACTCCCWCCSCACCCCCCWWCCCCCSKEGDGAPGTMAAFTILPTTACCMFSETVIVAVAASFRSSAFSAVSQSPLIFSCSAVRKRPCKKKRTSN